MRYIIMCGGTYKDWETPKQLTKVNGEPIVARTIRLLRECGVENIFISSNNPVFENFGVPVLHHQNNYEVSDKEVSGGIWCNGFYPTKDPVCYIFGDVVFSRAAIKTIVSTQTISIKFFASAPPFSSEFRKKYAEPFAFKVVDIQHFWRSIDKVKRYDKEGYFDRKPIAWELWQVIKGTPINHIDYTNYVVINDYTCDIDWVDEVNIFDGINLDE